MPPVKPPEKPSAKPPARPPANLQKPLEQSSEKPQVPLSWLGSLYWICSDSWEMTRRSVLHIIRSLDQVLSLLLFPIMFMLLNRYVLGGAIDTGDISYANYLFAGIFVQTLAFGANYTTINLAVDMQQGIIDRFKSLPMSSSALLFGHITADLARNIISGSVIIVVGLLIGFRPSASLMDWVFVILLGIVFSLAISWLSAIMGLLVKSLEAAQWVGFVVIFPLTFISSAFVPTETMSPLLRAFAENQPLTHTMNAIRAWLVGSPLQNSAYWAFGWNFALILITVPISLYLFQRRKKV